MSDTNLVASAPRGEAETNDSTTPNEVAAPRGEEVPTFGELIVSPELLRALGQARRRKRYIVAVMSSEQDAIHVTQRSTAGVNLAAGCGALVKSILGRLDPIAERKFLEEFVTELRKPTHAPNQL